MKCELCLLEARVRGSKRPFPALKTMLSQMSLWGLLVTPGAGHDPAKLTDETRSGAEVMGWPTAGLDPHPAPRQGGI